jgi:starvation-inducible DNA-binding protein
MRNSPSLSDADAKKMAAELSNVLADQFAIYVKTHGFHWNVEGPDFHELHLLLETQYTKLWEALDTIAERIRALGHYAIGSNSEMMKLAKVGEEKGVPGQTEMLQQLLEDHDICCAGIKKAHDVADDVDDVGSASLLEEWLLDHEEMAWMLRSQLKKLMTGEPVKSVVASVQ